MESVVRVTMAKVAETFQTNLAKLNIGRASIQLIEDILIDCYGQRLPLKQLASLSASATNMLTVNPWDKNLLNNIYNSLLSSELNLGVTNDGQLVYVNLPPLTSERRQELVKLIYRQLEEARIALRNTREESWRQVQADKQADRISRDDYYRQEKELNQIIDEFNHQLQQLAEEKEKQVLTI